VHSGLADVHVSGHAKRDELRILLSLTRPHCFVPVHGEFRHLSHHAALAREMGVAPERILLAEDGDIVELGVDGIDFAGEVPANYLYVDGIVGDVGHGVLRDRKVLAEEGVIVVVVTVDAKTGEILRAPDIITRGWVHASEAESLLGEASKAVLVAVEDATSSGPADVEAIRRRARGALGRFVSQRTRRRPMIVPVVTEV